MRGAYIWRGLYIEGLIFGILRYLRCSLNIIDTLLLMFKFDGWFQLMKKTFKTPYSLFLRSTKGTQCT